ncbi:MAG: Sec-independent protein translocase subunit TatB [Propionibacteriaceae bacterium]|nr:Sec-independent protein translocase subunit TatB [Propionibacteriaceae bacterium]
MDFNLWEITGLVILAIIVFGPEKLPELARKAARVLNYLRRIGNDARGQLRKELGDEFADVSLADLNPKAFIAKHLLTGDEVEDFRQMREEAFSAGTLVRDTLTDARDATTTAPDEDDPAQDAPAAAPGVREQPTDEPVAHVPFDPEAT